MSTANTPYKGPESTRAHPNPEKPMMITVRLSTKQHRKIKAAAKVSGKDTLNQFCLETILEAADKLVDDTLNPRIRAKQIGDNLRHII